MSDLERAFAFYWRILAPSAPKPKREYRFHDTRQWRFDFAWVDSKVAVECEGGVYIRGRHVRGSGFEDDCEKYNEATAAGWRVFRLTTGMLSNEPERWIGMIEEALDVEVLGR